MSKPYYVKVEIPKEIAEASYEALRQAKQTGKIRKGTNEVTKAIERGIAKLVVISEDVDPPEIVAHIPILCNEMNIPFVFVPQKELLGQAISIDIGTAAACIVEPGDAKATLDKIIDSLNNLKG